MPDVFVSYHNSDKEIADEIVDALERRAIGCWCAPRDVPAGANYGAAIISGIKQTRILVLVHSAPSTHSKYVQREVERAVALDKTVIPVRIDSAAPSPELEFFLGTPQWVDFSRGSRKELCEALANQVAALLQRASAIQAPTLASASTSTVTLSSWRCLPLGATIANALLLPLVPRLRDAWTSWPSLNWALQLCTYVVLATTILLTRRSSTRTQLSRLRVVSIVSGLLVFLHPALLVWRAAHGDVGPGLYNIRLANAEAVIAFAFATIPAMLVGAIATRSTDGRSVGTREGVVFVALDALALAALVPITEAVFFLFAR